MALSEELAQALRVAGVRDPEVLEALAGLDRRAFLPRSQWPHAEEDRPLPIGEGQTISQPSLVALMTEALGLTGSERVLEIGTGSGYQTALLAALAGEVYSVEVRPAMAEAARRRLLDELALPNVRLRVGDGSLGWPEAAPFDRIVLTAAPDAVPEGLLEQLTPGGRLLAPVGPAGGPQSLKLVTVDAAGGRAWRDLAPVWFVPLVPA
jgi:protein-L-isoaspartate(D-aspartate) O-methyltransferase